MSIKILMEAIRRDINEPDKLICHTDRLQGKLDRIKRECTIDPDGCICIYGKGMAEMAATVLNIFDE